MYIIKQSSKFKTSFKKYKSDKRFKVRVFENVLESLRTGIKLDAKYKDHQLSGELSDSRECHIAPDILFAPFPTLQYPVAFSPGMKRSPTFNFSVC